MISETQHQPALALPEGDHIFEAEEVRYLLPPPISVYPSQSPDVCEILQLLFPASPHLGLSALLCSLHVLSISDGRVNQSNHSILGEGIPQVRKIMLQSGLHTSSAVSVLWMGRAFWPVDLEAPSLLCRKTGVLGRTPT